MQVQRPVGIVSESYTEALASRICGLWPELTDALHYRDALRQSACTAVALCLINGLNQAVSQRIKRLPISMEYRL